MKPDPREKLLEDLIKIRRLQNVRKYNRVDIKDIDSSIIKLSEQFIYHRRMSNRPFKLLDPPGKKWASFSEFVLTEKDYEFKFEPYLADFQSSYFKALHDNRKWKCKWIVFQYSLIFIKAICLIPIGSILESVRKIVK